MSKSNSPEKINYDYNSVNQNKLALINTIEKTNSELKIINDDIIDSKKEINVFQNKLNNESNRLIHETAEFLIKRIEAKELRLNKLDDQKSEIIAQLKDLNAKLTNCQEKRNYLITYIKIYILSYLF